MLSPRFLNLPGYHQNWTSCMFICYMYATAFSVNCLFPPTTHYSSGWGFYSYCSAGIFIYYGSK